MIFGTRRRGFSTCLLCSAFAAFAGSLSIARSDEPSPAGEGPTTEAKEVAGESGEAPADEREFRFEPKSGLLPTARSIAMFERRVAASDVDTGSRITLGRLYLRKAKEDDDFSAFERAEALFREVLVLESESRTARLFLSEALQAQHRFGEALEVAEVVLKETPDDPKTLGVVGDARLELGRYDEAAEAYELLAEKSQAPPVLARTAHLAEMRGQTDIAIAAIEEAVQREVEEGRPVDSIAWYRWRLGSILWKAGRRDAAAEQFLLALELSPDDAQSMAGLAAVRAAQGRTDEAVELYEKAVEILPAPPLVVQYGDLLMRLGRDSDAAELYAELDASIDEEAASSAGKAHRREASRIFSARGVRSEQALEFARYDVETRQDVYAHDTLAWALYRNGNFDEAQEAIAKALEPGTQDPLLFFRAGMIAFHRDDLASAKDYLTRALKIDPAFAPLEAVEAKATLEKISSVAAE
ncbi:MAG TPA: tetratricopeptide repeat protein [Pirellulaceae bacterium]|jgi:tetratricopeptide (TPR) repeat protein|nr:tetratricopeptide repeat protein [Pirellulaceae bacterium]